MSTKATKGRFDILNNRILVRNSHKLVYKKLCNVHREQWCQKYLNVATSKLLDPKHTHKLPFSLPKRTLNEENNPSISTTSFMFNKRKSQVLAIHDSQEYVRSKTIDHDSLIEAKERAEKLLDRMKRTVAKPSLKMYNKARKLSIKQYPQHKSIDQFGIQPWLVDNHENDDKQNKFY